MKEDEILLPQNLKKKKLTKNLTKKLLPQTLLNISEYYSRQSLLGYASSKRTKTLQKGVGLMSST